MQSRFRLMRHPAHPMLVMFPVALFPLLVLLDVLYLTLGDTAFWTVGLWVAVAGLVMSLVASVPGLVDLAHIPNGSKAHRTALIHLVVGVGVIVLFAATAWARWPAGSLDRVALATGIDVLGLLLITAQGWLGGELVYKHHVGVLTESEGGEPVELTGSSTASPGASRGARRRGESRP